MLYLAKRELRVTFYFTKLTISEISIGGNNGRTGNFSRGGTG